MTGPMPSMPAMPGVQFGNTALDISSAVNSFAKGLQEARAQRRKEQMDQAMLGIRAMEAQGRMGQMENSNMQRFIDDLRAKGAFVNPGQSLVDTDWSTLVEQSQNLSNDILEWDLLSPKAQEFETNLYNQNIIDPVTGKRKGRIAPSRELRVPNLSGVGETVAQVYMDPATRQIWSAKKAHERGMWANQIREDYLQLAREKFAFQRADPTANDLSVVGGAKNMVEANRDLRSIEMNWPASADWSGAVKIFTSTELGDVLPQIMANSVLNSPEQKYYIAMHRWLSEFFPAKAGKVLTANEIKTYFPMLFATGFTEPETFDEIYKARNGAIRQVFLQSGPALPLAVQSGVINPGDVPIEVLQALQGLYGYGPSKGAPGSDPTRGSNPPNPKDPKTRRNTIIERQKAREAAEAAGGRTGTN